ncbi:MAG: alpha/beta hydrolase, partial [Spirochaetales bacterium]|nr:alpha/beta hydrolase [Spirochaetales bacterium]
LEEVRILGWSMGGNLAVDFALQHPERVSSLTLVAVRQFWCKEDIDCTRQGLHDVSGIGMEKFYRKCFLGAKADYKHFATDLLSFYANDRDVAALDTGLTYLATHRMPQSLPLPVHIIQGTKDVVCPEHEMVHLQTRTQNTMLDGAGHFPFSRADFRL